MSTKPAAAQADLTYITIASGFAYAALILDAWSRRVVGYAIGRGIEISSQSMASSVP